MNTQKLKSLNQINNINFNKQNNGNKQQADT